MITLPIHTSDSASQELQQRVALVLQSRQLVFGGRLRVEAHQGAVTLSGQVPTFYQRQLIYAAVRKVAGVTRVVDQLEVESQSAVGSPMGGRIIA
jgi:osmotically-inducible protein OsmY